MQEPWYRDLVMAVLIHHILTSSIAIRWSTHILGLASTLSIHLH